MPTRRSLLILLLAAGVFWPGCGSDSKSSGVETFSLGPLEIVLPFVPGVGETKAQVVGLKNLTAVPTSVTVTAFTPAGAPYAPGATPVLVPAQGEVRVPLTTFTGPIQAGGWVLVDTTGPAAFYTIAYMDRVDPGGFDDSSVGMTWRAVGGHVTLSGHADAYQLINGSTLGAGFVPGSFTVTMFSPGGVPFPPTVVPVGASGSVRFPVVGGTVGLVTAVPVVGSFPAGTTFKYAVAAREEFNAVFNEQQYVQSASTTLTDFRIGFDLEHGADLAFNHFDFSLLMSNTSPVREFITLNNIYDRDGNTLMPGGPRFVGLDPGATKYMSTRAGLSVGLEIGEFSVLAGLFADIATDPALQEFWVEMTFPTGVNLSARQHDPLFFSFYRICRTRQVTTQVNVSNLPIQTTTLGGIRNYVDIMNWNATPQTISIRGFTPMFGTEYVLGSETIPPFSRMTWSPDGTIFTEDPFDPLLPPVMYMSFNFSSTGGLIYNARKEVRDQIGFIQQIRPTPVYNLAFR